MTWARAWALGCILAAASAVTGTVTEVGPPLQPILVLGFLLVCPGMACVQLVGIGSRWHELLVAVALSIALAVLVAEVLLYTDRWMPLLGLVMLAVLTVALSSIRLVARRPGQDHLQEE